MIHLTVAPPLGIDSLVFSFVQRLAEQNGYQCVDVPAEHLDSDRPSHWIEQMGRSRQHYFLIGYRYPPSYWKQLAMAAATVAVVADGDGVTRQMQLIHQLEIDKGKTPEIKHCLEEIRHAVVSMVELTEWVLGEALPTRVLLPAPAFKIDSAESFRRLEFFYANAGVSMSSSCWQGFSEEAKPLLDQLNQVSTGIRDETQSLLCSENTSSSWLNAVRALFGDDATSSGPAASTQLDLPAYN